MKKRFALTGGIASGKSTVAAYIKTLGYPVFSCDEIYKSIITKREYVEKIKQIFPTCIKEDKIDRNTLSQIIFKDAEKREQLNEIAHPLIMEELYKQMDKCVSSHVFAEVPLLFEGNYENDFDKTIVVKRDREARVADIIKRDQVSRIEAEKRIFAQFDYDSPTADKRIEACKAIVIYNDGDFVELQKAVDKAISQIEP